MFLLIFASALAEEPRVSELLGPWNVTRVVRFTNCKDGPEMGETLPAESWTFLQMEGGAMQARAAGPTTQPYSVVIDTDGIRLEASRTDSLWLSYATGKMAGVQVHAKASWSDPMRETIGACAIVYDVTATRG